MKVNCDIQQIFPNSVNVFVRLHTRLTTDHRYTIESFSFRCYRSGMAHLLDSRIMKRDSEVFRVTEQQFEECKQANDNGAEYILEPKEGEMNS